MKKTIRKFSLRFLQQATAGISLALMGLAFAQPVTRPNFLIIMSDDQRYDTMDFMPRTKSRIFDQGVTFRRAYITTPVCCPSRASILTGMYASHHGVRVNKDTLRYATFMERLRNAGYFTGLIGKYLNSWDGSVRPEFKYWATHAGGGVRYFNPRLNVNGTWSVHNGYITYILRDHALEFLRRAAQQPDPFALIFAPNAPHQPADPATQDENLYPNLNLHRPASFNESDVSDKPKWLRAIPLWDSTRIAQSDHLRRKQLQSLHALDQAIEGLLDLLKQQNRLDNTAIIYISDNGYYWGEHRLKEKVVAYEEASHVPMALRYPPLSPGARMEDHIVANIDIAPTLYDLAGIDIPSEVDGFSLKTLLQDSSRWRKDLLIEGWRETVEVPYSAVHSGRYVYIESQSDSAELYDLSHDPLQLDNQSNNAGFAEMKATLKLRLSQLTAVRDEPVNLPGDFDVSQNYPNPFNPVTTLRLKLPQLTRVKIIVFDTLGREMGVVMDRELAAGEHSIRVEAQAWTSGIYFYRVEAGAYHAVKKMIVMK